MCSVTAEFCDSSIFRSGCSLPSENIIGYLNHNANIVIGATFMVHVSKVNIVANFTSKPPDLQCQILVTDKYKNMQALIFALDEINSDPEFLPNITLGFEIFDICVSLRKAAQGTLSMLSGGKEIIPNYHYQNTVQLAGVVGDAWSTSSILMAQILGLYRYPQITYLATIPSLSNRDVFPSFFRTVPSDEFQMRGLAQLISYFGWSWVGILVSNSDYGLYGLQVVKQEVINGGACVDFTEIILSGSFKNAVYLAQVIKKSSAKVVIVIAYDFIIVAEELLKQNVTGNIWIASESWSTLSMPSIVQYHKILLGTIGLAIHHGEMPNFNTYLSTVHPSKHLNDPFIMEYWEHTFSCKWLNQENIVLEANKTMKTCTGNEKTDSLLTEEYHRVSLSVYNAVYAIAWALQHLHNCQPGNGPFHGRTCANISSFLPWQLLHYVKNVQFRTKNGNKIFFDGKGNPPAVYDIVNWQLNTNRTLDHVVVGRYDFNAPDGRIFNIDNSKIIWTNNNTQVPPSTCSSICLPGSWKVILPGKPSCCYECAQCPQGQISNQTDAEKCQPCSWDTWPNVQQDRCSPRPIEFLSYEEPLGYSLVAVSILSSLFPLIILGIFIHHKKTPIVRANNFSISCLLLFSLFMCFLCSLGFIGSPQTVKCHLRQVAFGTVFSLCVSCVLAKTMIVVIAFNATKPGSRLRKLTGVKVTYSVIIFSVFIQLCVCVFWVIFSPPFPELDTITKAGVIIIICNEGSPTAFWCMLGYLGLLATISFLVAFMARRLPDSFNEAKLITFSMLAFLSVWVSFIPAYLSARGMYTTAMEVFAILSSTWAVVICMFIPKGFVILFKPNMNNKEYLMKKDKGQK